MQPEKLWTTAAGLPAVVIMTDMGHRCGYVGVPTTHPLYGNHYTEPNEVIPPGYSVPESYFDVHGGLTYSDDLPGCITKCKIDGEIYWWFGFDCGHTMDDPCFGNTHRSCQYVVTQCEFLAEQLVECRPPSLWARLKRGFREVFHP